jgi:hypothetical protein
MKNLLMICLFTLLAFTANAFDKQKPTENFNDTVYAGDALENAGVHIATAFIIGVGTAIAIPVLLAVAVPAGIVYIVAEGAIIMTGAFSISGLKKMIRAGKLLKRRELELIKLEKK